LLIATVSNIVSATSLFTFINLRLSHYRHPTTPRLDSWNARPHSLPSIKILTVVPIVSRFPLRTILTHGPPMMGKTTPLLSLLTATAVLLTGVSATLDPIIIKVWDHQTKLSVETKYRIDHPSRAASSSSKRMALNSSSKV
jgi:hypothetical protein